MSLDEDVGGSLAEAARMLNAFNEGMTDYQSAVVRGDSAAAETVRDRLHVALDGYLDSFGAAHLRLAREPVR